MFRTSRRYFVFAISSVLPLASLAVGVYLKLSSPTGKVIAVLFAVFFAISAAASYYVHIKPFRDLASAVIFLLDNVGQRIIDVAQFDGIEARLNYLAISRPARFLFFRRFFRVAWGLGMRYEPDNTVQFHVSKGVAGRAFHDRRSTLVDLELPRNRNFGGFSDKEKEAFPLLTAIWSLPIFELDGSGNATGKILGTINLDSETPGAWSTFSGNAQYEGLLEELQDLVSKVASC